ncbi:MAG: Rrf2 family transcriptional regulator [candidate division Zixibacteria bacterium]|nr:Rrf2 family transcriptional regulator [candidate division Zixibacteria bacterium]
MLDGFSASAIYGVHIIHYLSQHPEKPSITSTEIARAYNIPYDSTMKVLRQLAKSGLVMAHRGFKGGFSLRKTAQEISLGDVVESIEGSIEVRDPLADTVGDGMIRASIGTIMTEALLTLRNSIKAITIDHLGQHVHNVTMAPGRITTQMSRSNNSLE